MIPQDDILADARAAREQELRALVVRFRSDARRLRELRRRISRAVECIPKGERRRFRTEHAARLRRVRFRTDLCHALASDRLLSVAAVAPWSLQRLGGTLAEAAELLSAAERQAGTVTGAGAPGPACAVSGLLDQP